MASADPIHVEYDIGPYAEGNYGASYAHESTGCESPSQFVGYTLYMCGGTPISITGSISGMLDGGILTGITGYLTDGHFVVDIIGGVLGPFVDANDFSWLSFETGDVALFEPFSMGSGMPNYFDGDEFILWGQSLASYHCPPDADTCDGNRFGLDLYGKRVSVPEPGTLALFGIGLLLMGFTRRRQLASIGSP